MHHAPYSRGELAIPERARVVSIVGIALAVVAAVVAGSVAVSAAFMPGCARCHMVGTFKSATESGSHAELECSACHGGTTVHSRTVFGVNQVFGMVGGMAEVDPSIAYVASAKCSTCHETQLEKPTESSGLRVRHETCAVGRECTDCHSPVAHGTAVSWPRTVTMEMCFECHGKGNVGAECDSCHTAKLPTDRVQSGSFSVTHGPNYKQTHGMGSMDTCAACHVQAKCAKCHGPGLPHEPDFVSKHGPFTRAPNAKCTTCHVERFCTDCHLYSMPHPARFVADHSDVVERDGQAGCLRCHAQNDCQQCHLDHVHPVTLDQQKRLGIDGEGDDR